MFFRTLLSHQFHTLLKHQNHPSNSHRSFSFSSFFQRPTSAFPQSKPKLDGSKQIEENEKNGKKKPLNVMLKELKKKLREREVKKLKYYSKKRESPNKMDGGYSKPTKSLNAMLGNNNKMVEELKKRLRELEREVKRLKDNSKERENPNKMDGGDSKPTKSLHAMLRNNNNKMGKELEKRLREREVKRLKDNSKERESPNKMDGGDSKPTKSLHAMFRNNNDKMGKELKKRLSEREVKRLKDNSKERESPNKMVGGDSKPTKSLHAMIRNNNKKMGDGKKDVELESLKEEEPTVFKELTPDMVFFVSHLYKKGYFNDLNFLRRWMVFDVSCFKDIYSWNYIKFAAVKFGKDNQEIAKWLSVSDLKTVALFGCPSLTRKNVFFAKRLRAFFGIEEDTCVHSS